MRDRMLPAGINDGGETFVVGRADIELFRRKVDFVANFLLRHPPELVRFHNEAIVIILWIGGTYGTRFTMRRASVMKKIKLLENENSVPCFSKMVGRRTSHYPGTDHNYIK
uniref:Uncharacterized protein n=1 Tax=Cucumis sativus TaxID=3659 RepID=A0A0A0LHG3_CUCSA